jgi:hypothetical protein
MMNKIATLCWVPGYTVHNPGTYSRYHFVVVLQVDVVSWTILTYTIRSDEAVGSQFSPALIDMRHPNRFWLWQADKVNLAANATWVIPKMRPTRFDYDVLGPWRVVGKLPPGKLSHLTKSLMKGFYDLNALHLAHFYRPTATTNTLLLQRIEGAIQYANSVASRPTAPPHI